MGFGRLGEKTLAVGVGGGRPYSAQTRTAVISTYTDGQWGYEASSSRWQGFSWTASGAAFFNFLLSVKEETHLVFNEVKS